MAELNAEVTHQAMVVAYVNDFKLMMVVALVALPMIFLLKCAKAQTGNVAALDYTEPDLAGRRATTEGRNADLCGAGASQFFGQRYLSTRTTRSAANVMSNSSLIGSTARSLSRTNKKRDLWLSRFMRLGAMFRHTRPG
jgi:hypothetical protein